MESVNFAETLDEIDKDVNFIFEIVFFWEDKLLEWLFHGGNCGEVSNNLLCGLNDDVLIEVLIFIHVGQKGKEAVFIEHFNIIGLVLIEDVT